MSLKPLFESLDEKVFTPELKESLEIQFNEAVEAKAIVLAEEKIEEMEEKTEQHIQSLNEKAEEYKEELVNSLNGYLERVVEEFVAGAKDSLDASIAESKADLVIEAFDSMLVATGVEIARIKEAKDTTEVEAKLEENVSKYDSLMDEFIALKEENEKLIKLGIINEMKEGLSLVEAEKFVKLADLVDFTKDEVYAEKLETIKESVKGAAEEKVEESVEDEQEKPSWAHLI
jgi:hypothetical protein